MLRWDGLVRVRRVFPQIAPSVPSLDFRPLAILMPLLLFLRGLSEAGVAQLVEHLICNQRVGGSIPSASSTKMFLLGPEVRRGLRRGADPEVQIERAGVF